MSGGLAVATPGPAPRTCPVCALPIEPGFAHFHEAGEEAAVYQATAAARIADLEAALAAGHAALVSVMEIAHASRLARQRWAHLAIAARPFMRARARRGHPDAKRWALAFEAAWIDDHAVLEKERAETRSV